MATEESSFTQNSFNQWMKERRRALDLTREELSKCAGCSPVTVQKIELGERRPSREVAHRLAHCLKIPPQYREEFIMFARGGPVAGAHFTFAGDPATQSSQPPFTEPERP